MRTEKRSTAPAEVNAIILFRVGQHRMAIWARDVQEIRIDLGLSPAEMGCQSVLYAHTLFNVPPGHDARLIVLKGGDVGVGVDRVERMIETAAPLALPHAFQGSERRWYLGLIDADGALVPLVNPETLESEAVRRELEMFDATWAAEHTSEAP